METSCTPFPKLKKCSISIIIQRMQNLTLSSLVELLDSTFLSILSPFLLPSPPFKFHFPITQYHATRETVFTRNDRQTL